MSTEKIPPHRVCGKCYKPKEIGVIKCDQCESEEDTFSPQYYTIKQWEHFIDSLKGGAVHDFSPWEFSEDGRITRNDFDIKTGPQPPKKET